MEFTCGPLNLYLVLMSSDDNSESFYKIGVTSKTSVEERFGYGAVEVAKSGLSLREMLDYDGKSKYISDHPYKYESICFVRYRLGMDAFQAEQKLLEFYANLKYKPQKSFSGDSECFNTNGFPLDKVINFMKEDSQKKDVGELKALLYRLYQKKVREQDPLDKHLAILKKIDK